MKRIIFLTLFTLSVQAQNIPEPMVFDLIRPLGEKAGAFEVNTLTNFGIKSTNTATQYDPFSSSATSIDKQMYEWAPEVEYALFDDFAVEFEVPFKGTTLEAYKFGAQYTLPRRGNTNYIDGFQLIVEPTYEFKRYNTTLTYIGAFHLNEAHSILYMVGARSDLEGSDKLSSFEAIANFNFFAAINSTITVGLETNYSLNMHYYSLMFIPQLHAHVTKQIDLQVGVGVGNATYAKENSLFFRFIYALT